ncbi:DUF1839 family protein [Paraburkholderia ginsengisoli]|jgi:hypothetical protein|uniref:DUF1839 family protein n=1 Tax=Paraburkholderia ginsengisoli TaxID=311231 RepID=A0A7T4N8R9_9BURK|nr:DUF1839 family protein [Paraburkholderia ginsengisoli]QQC67287.1 DUF1839 family protein [Paraburkholderia ginsengisoli]
MTTEAAFVTRASRDLLREAQDRMKTWRAHPLHGPTMVRKQTNCYVDLWIELLAWWGLDPHAALPFTVALDFEGDEFTFFKFPPEDIERLYGVLIQEHAIFEPLEVHVANQLRRGGVMLVEVDAWHLPDTRGVAYQQQHTKTTIGIHAIDSSSRQLGYFHNSGYYFAEGADYDGLLDTSCSAVLPPYVECARRRFAPLAAEQLRETSLSLLRRHLLRRPAGNPITAFGEALARDASELACRPMAHFHAYSFNTLRQLGANFELLGQYFRWLNATGADYADSLDTLIAACDTIASESMVLEFRLARACSKGKADHGEGSIEILERAYASLMSGIDRVFSRTQPASQPDEVLMN